MFDPKNSKKFVTDLSFFNMPLLPRRGSFGAELNRLCVVPGYKHATPNGADL